MPDMMIRKNANGNGKLTFEPNGEQPIVLIEGYSKDSSRAKAQSSQRKKGIRMNAFI